MYVVTCWKKSGGRFAVVGVFSTEEKAVACIKDKVAFMKGRIWTDLKGRWKTKKYVFFIFETETDVPVKESMQELL